MNVNLISLLVVFILSADANAQLVGTAEGPIPDSIYQEIQWQKKQIAEKMQKSSIEYFVIHVPDGKFGYYILIDGNLSLQQLAIPGLEGNDGFERIEEAEKVAMLVVEKMKQGEMPPTISKEDLKKLNIISDQ